MSYPLGCRCKLVLIVLMLVFALAGCNDDGNVSLPFASAGGSSGTTSGDGTNPSNPNGGDGDGTPPGQPPMLCAADAPATEASTTADVTTQSTDVDGKTIDVHMSVFRPALDKGQCAPVIIKSHGFGGNRIQDLSSIQDDGNVTAVAARNAWQDGYFVVTFDQRGFGQTGGKVHVEDPDYEGNDIPAVLDYAGKNLGEHLALRNGDPLVGALGDSYGGGFQLLGAAVDPRFDALVPTATWYSLPFSLDPNGAPKTAWLNLLVALGSVGSQGSKFQLAPFIYNGFVQAETTGQVSDKIVKELGQHGLNAYCDGTDPSGKGVPQVSAFFIQGAADTLFNMNNAVDNAECLRNAGNDVRVLIERTGHILPLLQQKHDAVGFAVDKQVTCGNQTFDTAALMVAFLDEKLRDMTPKQPIPKNCLVQNDTHGIVTDQFPIGGDQYPVPEQQVTTGPAAGDVNTVVQNILTDSTLLAAVAQSTDQSVTDLTTTLQGLATSPDDYSNILTAGLLEALPPELLNDLTNPKTSVTLFTAQQNMTIAGIPTADLTVSALGDNTLPTDPIVFIGLGLTRDGSNDGPQLIDQQVAPLRGSGEYKQQLVGVSKDLHQGDKVSLLVYGFDNQYFGSFNDVPEQVTLSGNVSLPLQQDNP